MPESTASSSGIYPRLVQPLDEFYARQGQALPPLQQVDGQEVPEPMRTLLVHEGDMTSTLEEFHGGRLIVEVLGRQRAGNDYAREVVLRMADTGVPVEFGAIRIDLGLFSGEARKLIMEEHWPLGRILKHCNIEFTSRPVAYLRIASDPLINDLLHLAGAHVLYGRRNSLLDSQGRSLAEIVEILPPPRESARGGS